MSPNKRSIAWAAPLALLTLGTITAILVAEWAASRFAVVDTPPGLFRSSATRAFEHRPGFKGYDRFRQLIHINSRGLRDREYAVPKPQQVHRILVLGDSVTFGDGVKAEDTYPKQLEEILSGPPDGPEAEVLNAGVRGYNTFQELTLLREAGLAYAPDTVIVGYVLNDAEPIAKQAGLIDPKYGTVIRIKNWIRDHSYLYALLRRSFELFRHRTHSGRYVETYEDQFAENHPGWLSSLHALRDLKALTDEKGIRLLLVIIPRFESLQDPSVYPWKKIHEQVARAAGSFGIETLDLLPEFAGEDPSRLTIVPTDSFHPNPQGHRRIAEAIARHLHVHANRTS